MLAPLRHTSAFVLEVEVRILALPEWYITNGLGRPNNGAFFTFPAMACGLIQQSHA